MNQPLWLKSKVQSFVFVFAVYSVLAFSGTAAAQDPALIRGLSAMNAASFAPEGLPHSGVAPGSRFVVMGKGFPTDAAAVTGKVTVGDATMEVTVLSAAADRIEALLPESAGTGRGTVELTINEVKLTAPIRVVASAYGVYTRAALGKGLAMATGPEGVEISVTRPAVAGEVVTLRGTGFGADAGTPEVLIGSVAPISGTVTREEQGIDLVRFEVPAEVEGCAVPVAVRTANGFVSNFAQLPVAAASGTACRDAFTPTGFDADRFLREGLRIGTVSLSRSEISTPEFAMQSDSAGGSFFRLDSTAVAAGSTMMWDSVTVGACTVVYLIEQDIPDPFETTALDAGAKLTLTGPKGQRTLTRESKGNYAAQLGEGIVIDIPGFPGLPGSELFLDAGEYTVTGEGGDDVGAFSAKVTIGQPIRWTNADSMSDVDRSKDLEVVWQNGTAQQMVTLTGMAALPEVRPTVAAMFFCTARGDSGRITVPSAILSALPVATEEGAGILTLAASPLNPVEFTAPGIDLGMFDFSQAKVRLVSYR